MHMILVGNASLRDPRWCVAHIWTCIFNISAYLPSYRYGAQSSAWRRQCAAVFISFDLWACRLDICNEVILVNNWSSLLKPATPVPANIRSTYLLKYTSEALFFFSVEFILASSESGSESHLRIPSQDHLSVVRLHHIILSPYS